MLNRSPRTSVLNMGTGTWQPCLLTWYDPALGGINSGTGAANPTAPTASGEPYDASAYTCAAPPAYAFGTQIMFRVGGTAIQCRVNDRGGAIQGSHFDLSRAAANALGILGAGRMNGSFQVVGVGGAPAAANDPTNQGAGPGLGTIANDLLNPLNPLGPLDLVEQELSGSVGKSLVDGFLGLTGDVAGKISLILVAVIKDAAQSFGDYILLPGWHWNQRAVAYYAQYYLLPADKEAAKENWTALPWTAAFWGFGYYLLWTDPEQRGLKPAAPSKSRMARHIRRAQAVPARKSLIKPGDVKEKTPTKPKPVVSAASIRQTGTLRTERSQAVRVTGDGINGRERDNTTRSEVPIDRAGTVPQRAHGDKQRREQTAHPPRAESDQGNRTRPGPPTDSAHPTTPATGASTGGGGRVGRRRVTAPDGKHGTR